MTSKLFLTHLAALDQTPADCEFGRKAELLFAERRLEQYCDTLEVKHVSRSLPKLVALQVKIYALDQYFEANWDLSRHVLQGLWRSIIKAATEITRDRETANRLLDDIRRYQELEVELRRERHAEDCPGFVSAQFGVVDSGSLYGRYKLKTCDVRLARRLVAQQAPRVDPLVMRAWDLFDIISECCDDLNDWGEDLPTYNGNQFICLVTRKRESIRVFGEYEHLLRALGSDLQIIEAAVGPRHRAGSVVALTGSRLDSLRELIHEFEKHEGAIIEDCLGGALAAQQTAGEPSALIPFTEGLVGARCPCESLLR